MSHDHYSLLHELYPTHVDLARRLTKRFAYNGDGRLEYEGEAAPGALEESPVWLVRRHLYDNQGRPVSVLFAGGADSFTSVWSDRESLIYG